MAALGETSHVPSAPFDDHDQPVSHLITRSVARGLPRPVEAYMTAKDGAKIRYAHWRTPKAESQGVVLFLSGRTEFIEKAIDSYALLIESGFDLWSFDWRGQGLSQRSLADPHKGHIDDYQTYLDDLEQFIHDISDLPARHDKKLILAHSMGGHVGLRFLHDHPGLIDAAVLSAPMIDISVNKPSLRRLNHLISRLGLGKNYALGTGPYRPIYENPADLRDNGTIDDYKRLVETYQDLSRDARKRAEIERHVRENPNLALGGPTAAWLDATFRSINLTWTAGYAEEIATPVLMIGGGRDTTVVTARQAEMTKRMPKGAFCLIEEGGHELLVECDDVYRQFFDALRRWADVDIRDVPIDMTDCIRVQPG